MHTPSGCNVDLFCFLLFTRFKVCGVLSVQLIQTINRQSLFDTGNQIIHIQKSLTTGNTGKGTSDWSAGQCLKRLPSSKVYCLFFCVISLKYNVREHIAPTIFIAGNYVENGIIEHSRHKSRMGGHKVWCVGVMPHYKRYEKLSQCGLAGARRH